MKNRFVVALMTFLLLSGCAKLFDPAAAVVAGQKISVEEVEEGVEDFKKTPEYEQLVAQGDAQAIERQYEQQLLSELIRAAVLTPEAEERGIEVGDDEIDERLQEIKDDYGSEAEFEKDLEDQHLTLEELRGFISDRILEEKLKTEVTADLRPTEQELQAFYEENIDRFTETRTQHILVEDEATATRLADRLQRAPRSQVEDLFEDLAAEFSTDESNADDGGDLGHRPAGELVEPYERAAARLEEGDVSDPVQTEFGFHVIRVIDRRAAPFEEVSDQLAEQLGGQEQEEAWQQFVRDAYEAADIRVNSRYGELDLETQQVVDATAEDIPGAEVDLPSPTPTPTL